MDGRIYKIALGLLQGIGIVRTKTLVSYVGSLEKLFSATDKELCELAGISLIHVKKFNRQAALIRAEKEVEFIDENGIQLHYYKDVNYPPNLKFVDDGPIVLFSKGNIRFDKKNIAIVGTRKATAYGKDITHKFVQELAHQSVQIISGLAHGIDKEAHEAALENHLSTIAVLGHGFDMIYPAAHRGLAKRMLDTGGLVTEFLSFSPGDPSNFPKRNRIVAGLSDATVVIESATSGGSLITANLANDYNRVVFAFPGNIDRPTSQGCNNLIRRDKAHLITCAEDLITTLDWEIDDTSPEIQSNLFEALTIEEEPIVKLLQTVNNPIHIDEISHKVGLTTSVISLHLFNLEMRGMLKSLPGAMYQVN